MKDLIRSKMFGLGFLIGIVVFILINVFYPTEINCSSTNLCNYDGFPLASYRGGYEEKDGGNYIGEILWIGLVGNLLFALMISFITGLSLSLFTHKESSFE